MATQEQADSEWRTRLQFYDFALNDLEELKESSEKVLDDISSTAEDWNQCLLLLNSQAEREKVGVVVVPFTFLSAVGIPLFTTILSQLSPSIRHHVIREQTGENMRKLGFRWTH